MKWEPSLHRRLAALGPVLVLALISGCAGAQAPVPETIAIPAGLFVMGSDRAEREAAYRLDEAAYGHGVTRKQRWYEAEGRRSTVDLPAFRITRAPITNSQYAAFVAATGHPPPDVAPGTWAGYRLIHPYERTRRHAWTGGGIPEGREEHPVVLVSHADARAYARWLGKETRQAWRLPTEAEWEKAVRGPAGGRFPWGNGFDPAKLNSADRGPFDTLPVGRFLSGAGPHGVMDGAGQVFEWTSTASGNGRYIVKGGSWDDKGCGVCRPAARHGRPAAIKHILVGFRLVRPAAP